MSQQQLATIKVHDGRYEVRNREGKVRVAVVKNGILWKVDALHRSPGTGCATASYAIWRAFVAGLFLGDLMLADPEHASDLVRVADETFTHNRRVSR